MQSESNERRRVNRDSDIVSKSKAVVDGNSIFVDSTSDDVALNSYKSTEQLADQTSFGKAEKYGRVTCERD